MEKFAGGAIAVICGSMLIHGKHDLSELKRAVNEIYRLNDAMRIRISETDGEASQCVTEYAERNIEVLHFDDKAELDRYAENYAKTPIDFYGNLCEFNIVILPKQYGLLVKLHHIIGDAWTLSLIGNQFNAILNGEAVEAYSYTDYIENEKAYIESKRYEKDKAFFLEQFKKCDEVTYITEKRTDNLSACRKTFAIDSKKTSCITSYAQQNGTSAFMMFTAALSAYINRTKMNSEKFYIGTAVLNRNGTKEKNTMGMLVNTVPMLIELDNNKSFAENLSAIETTAFSVFRHQKYNYGDVLSAIRTEYNFTEKLYDVMISYQNATIVGNDIETTWYHSGMQNESLQIHIDDRDNEGFFRIHYDFQTEKFTEYDIDMLHQHISNLLFDAVANDNKNLYELELLTADEKHKLLYAFNDTAVDYPKDKCVHQLFEEQVEKTPNKTAVIACDKTLTYKELNEQANRIAHSLTQRGVKVGDIVAIKLYRKSYLFSAILGAIKCGATYMPIDPTYPEDRIEYMLIESKAKGCIDENNVIELLANKNVSNLNIAINYNNTFCALHTSGSTGKPKMSLLTHGGMMNFISANQRFWNNIDTVVSATIVTFDAFVMDSILSVVQGKPVVLASEDEIYNHSKFERLFDHSEHNMFFSTPTKIENYIKNSKDKRYLSKIKSYVIGGEVFSEHLLNLIYKYSPDSNVYNIYGPTETTICAMVDELDIEKDITIGKPIANTQIYIVNQYMCPTPIGVTGELCIAGDGVGAGYLNRPELTAEKFIDNPFGKGKLYKTGDLAYWREDGNIVYVGRNDFQVKIRGLRIELGEIENAICSMDGISQAVVVVRKNNEGRQLICAFYTGAETDAKEIRSHIGKKLPKYMLPHIFTHLDVMPLTSSGKINRKALPEIDLENIVNDTEYVTPENQQQKELCKLIESVLGTTPVGITDDFFDLGGDSLKAIEFVSKAHNEGIYFNLQNVFDYSTVKALCECIETGDKKVISFANVDFTEVHKVLEKNKVEYMNVPQKCDVGNILLAGATGFLGIHILSDYLDNDTGTAYCLVRGKDKMDSTNRLKELLNFYFGDKYAAMDSIEVICADLQKNNFGLADAEYAELLGTVDTVINCAASVKHYGTYKYFYEVNVETTKQLIEFCKQADSKLIHISTLSVSGNGFDNDLIETEIFFSERDLYIGQPLDNVYARSKFEAEKEVIDAMFDGLQANIMRMGNLTNRLSDGQFQKNHESNAFLKRIKALTELKAFTSSFANMKIDFTPIDEAAKSIMLLVRNFNNNQNVFHIKNKNSISLYNLFEFLRELHYEVDMLTDEEFDKRLYDLDERDSEYIFEAFINDIDENDRLNYDSNIRIENDFTVQYLKMLGFEWKDIDIDYLRKYIEYFKKIGYFR